MLSASRIVFALSLLALQVSANCMHGTYMSRRAEGEVKVSNFGYSGTIGPLNWASIDSANSQCAMSKVQSPIVIDSSVPFATEAPKISFKNVEEAEFENLGSTIEVIADGTTNFAGKDFTLKQFHFHTPSEHRINDEYFPLEIHMVHEAADKSIAVLALPFQLTEDGSTTQLLTNVIKNITDIAEPGTVTKTGPLDFGVITETLQTKKLFQYTGSLTTPPCAEGLTFLVLSEPLPIDVKTFNTIKKTIKFNARYSQNKLGDRNLLDIAAEQAAKDGNISNAQCSFAQQPAANKAQSDLNKVMQACTTLCEAAHPMSRAIMEAKHVAKNMKRHHH
ncbi:alpha carbonic anhydrase [Daedaleopsis nitida]|nr:alpha carbonic anhydrase [Daedaleopsis nitida]